MAKVPIVAYGSDILRCKCVDAIPGPQTDQCIQNLIDTLPDNGVGMAACQINVPLNVFIIKYAGIISVYINPVIIKALSGSQPPYNEGCLSIPNIYADVYGRPKTIEVRSFNELWKSTRRKLTDFEARVFLHEFDHINGILFIDHLTAERQKEIVPELEKIENGEMDVNYDMLLKTGEIKPQISATKRQ